MKNLLLSLMLLFAGSFSFAQSSTTVSLTVTGPDGQAWTNGTLNYTFISAPNYSGQSYWGPNPLPANYLTPTTVALSPTATATFTIPDSSTITPIGNQWKFVVCPDATYTCVTVNMPVSGSNQDISANINAAISIVTIGGTPVPLAYRDSQITTAIRQGSIYYNTTTNVPRYFDGSAWHDFGGGSGGACPGAAGHPIGYWPTATGLICPSGVTIDPADTTNESVYVPHMVNEKAVDTAAFATPYYIGNGAYAYQYPMYVQMMLNTPAAYNTFAGAFLSDVAVLNTENYGVYSQGPGSYPNIGMFFTTLHMKSPNQLGGYFSTTIDASSNGDVVVDEFTVRWRGITQGFSEGGETARHFISFNPYVPHGNITLLSADTLNRQPIQYYNTQEIDQFGQGNIIIDDSKEQSPAGNITSGGCGTTSFIGVGFACVTVDATMNAALTTLFGGTTHQTQVTGGADFQQYNGACPATVVAPNWPDTPVNGVNYSTNPYASGPNGIPLHTSAQCVSVTSTAGLTVGTVVGFFSTNDNWEYEKVVAVPDGTHIVVPLNYAHNSGEMVVWGPGIGWGADTPLDELPPGTLNTAVTIQYDTNKYVYPIAYYDSVNRVIFFYINYDVTNNTELKMAAYSTATPPVPATVGLTVVGGVVTATTNNANNYTSPVFINGWINVLPPPSYTLTAACTTNPTFNIYGNGSGGYTWVVNNGGTGCPTGLGMTFNNTYPNQLNFYPMSRTLKVQNPTNNCWNCGYVLAYPFAAPTQWANGDISEQTVYWQQYASGNEQTAFSPKVRQSTRYGVQATHGYAFPQNSQHVMYYANQTPATYYFGDSTTSYLSSSNPAKGLYAQGDTPVLMGVGGSVLGVIDLTGGVPTGVSYGKLYTGYILRVGCDPQGADQAGGQTPCVTRNIFPYFDIFRFDAGGEFAQFGWDHDSGTWQFNGSNGIVVGGHYTCLDNGAHCFVGNPVYTLKFYAQAYNYPSNAEVFFGGSEAYTYNSSTVYQIIPNTCRVFRIIATATLNSGVTNASTQNVQFKLHDDTQGTDIALSGWTNWSVVQNVYDSGAMSSPLYTINPGDHIWMSVFPPLWTPSGPTGPVSVSYTLDCR